MKTASASSQKAVLAVFSFTLFLSAACMFALQPMAGKMLLPLVGGTPAGWVVAMAYFQVMLLGGYLLAHLLAGFSPRVHAVLYLAALGTGLLCLPVNIGAHAGLIQGTPGPADIFRLLAATLTVPFVALSATSSTIQRLFMTTGHAASKDPFFLYAASNLGSFAGLLSYPIFIEPRLTLTAQTQGWQAVYVLLAAAAALCLLLSGTKREKAAARDGAAPVPPRRYLLWLALAFFPSSLLLGVTTFITTDIISVPLIWVIPLAIYLLTFVAAFARRPPVSLNTVSELAVGAAVIAIAFSPTSTAAGLGAVAVVLHLICFAVLSLYCNTRLAALRPPGGRLTGFYLTLALGGALGGLFNAFVAPHVFIRVIEYPLCLLAFPLLLPGNGLNAPGSRLLAVLLGVILLTANAAPLIMTAGAIHALVALCGLLIVAAMASPRGRALFLFPVLACFFLVSTFLVADNNTVYMTRNFFGALRVYEADDPARGGPARYFTHGTTLHGFELLGKSNIPTAYYTKNGPLGDAFRAFSPKRVAVIGLGAGTVNCYSAPNRSFTFIDIDPDVIDIATKRFRYLDACKSARPPRLIAGDGRLEMAKLKDEKFDMLVLDAFSSDSIPMHLLTEEALKLYFDRLGPKGVLLVHISNHHFRLHTPIATTADAAGLQSKVSSMELRRLEPWATKSVWVVVARENTDLNGFAKKYGWQDIARDPSLKAWTDDYTNLLSALHFG